MNNLITVACLVLLTSRVTAFDDFDKEPLKPTDRVKISVFYEALCEDSQRFITEQLAPTWKKLGNIIEVDLIPYGKCTRSKVKGQWTFTCQHGRDEVYGNKVQACIMKNEDITEDHKMELITCLMTQPRPDKSLRQCLGTIQLMENWADLKRCANGKEGDELLALNGIRTDAVQTPLNYAPTIVINDEFNEKIHRKALQDLKLVVISMFKVNSFDNIVSHTN